ncbi:MAG: hypothetical protein AAGI90_06120 [Chlamydiota bacterium]
MIQEVKPYNSYCLTDTHLQSSLDKRSCVLKILHAIQSVWNECKYLVMVAYYRYVASIPQLRSKSVTWNPDSQGLIVFIHGLRNDPAAWFSQLSLLPPNTKMDIFAPVVHKRGVCPLDQAVNPLLPKIEDYVKKNPKKPVCLLGTSNGSRVAAEIETRLREISPGTPVKVSSVAGPHLGSSSLDLFDRFSCGLANWRYPDGLKEELKYNSDKAKELLRRIKTPLPKGCAPRSYEFYATTEDITIPDLVSTLPKLTMREKHYLVHGESHGSIVSAIAKQQMDSCFAWMNSV